MDKQALVRWLQYRLDDYRKRSPEAELLHLDTRAAEVAALLDAVEKESYQNAKRHEGPDRGHEQDEGRGEEAVLRQWDGFGADGDPA